ncbi:XkdX family protein [Limosilactobacillus mucosae]|uniref:XkdX family protein n=1 Tax=Limosilactobacillus mucosae TaxID=97478 RepID=UPI0022E4781D|nr:XkdX family protein [Limosilactobacillus mucosae]
MTDFDFVKTIYSWGFPIDCYVLYRTITKDQYKEITGKDYVAVSSATATDSGSANAAQSANTAVSQA